MKQILIIFFAVTFLGCNSNSKKESTEGKLEKNETFPFTVDLLTIKGDTINSSKFTTDGQIALIDFWNSHCGPCMKMFDAVRDKNSEWKQKTNFKIIAIAAKMPDKNIIELIKKRKWPIEIYFDPDYKLFGVLSKFGKRNKLGKDYNLNYINYGFPTMFVFNKNWKMIDKIIGAKQKIKEEVIIPNGSVVVKNDIFEIDLDYYYNLYSELKNTE